MEGGFYCEQKSYYFNNTVLFLVSFSVSAYTWNGYLRSWTRTNLPDGRYGYDREIWRSGYGIYLKENPPLFGSKDKEKYLYFNLDYNASVDVETLTVEYRNPHIEFEIQYYSGGKWNVIHNDTFTYSANLKGNKTHIYSLNSKGTLKRFSMLPKGRYRIRMEVRTRGVLDTQWGGIAVRLGVNKAETKNITSGAFYRRSEQTTGSWARTKKIKTNYALSDPPSKTISFYNNTGNYVRIKNNNYRFYSANVVYDASTDRDGDLHVTTNGNSYRGKIKIKNGGTIYDLYFRGSRVVIYRNSRHYKTLYNQHNRSGYKYARTSYDHYRYGDNNYYLKAYVYRYDLKSIFDKYPEITTVAPGKRIYIYTYPTPGLYIGRSGKNYEEKRDKKYQNYITYDDASYYGTFYYEVTTSSKPSVKNRTNAYFTENKYNSFRLGAVSEAGNYPLKFYKVWGSGVNITRDGRVTMDLRGNYSIDKHTDDKHHYNRRMRVKVVDSKGNVDYGYVYIYIASAPYPIGNVSYLNYPSIPNKPTDLSYNKPDLNKFNNTLLKPSPLNTYPFINVSSKVEYPGLSPKITPTESKVILYSLSSLSYQDIRNNPDFKNTQNVIDNFEQAKNMWEKVQDYYNNTEKKDIDYQYGKEYLKAKEEYNYVREVLQTRIEDINYNQYLYDRYRCKVNSYNLNIKNQINNYVNYYNNDYLPKINSWIRQKSNYFNSLNNVERAIERRYSINKDRKRDKEKEIDYKKRMYGLVSLQKSEINPIPSPGNYRNIIADIKNRFDNSNKLSLGDGFKDILTVNQRNSIDHSSNPKETIYNIFKITPQTTGEIEGSNNYQINNENKPLNCSLGYKEYEDLNYDAERDGLNEDVIRWEKDRYNKIY